ncbi:MAG: hypothetical protein KGI41_00165 [Patescibacteria group bacterium]|nr:hypothetical protein [Patescibacteria group bacterium]MDE1965646.1 hypothetical protein [Patescibacteria group bacterium]
MTRLPRRAAYAVAAILGAVPAAAAAAQAQTFSGFTGAIVSVVDKGLIPLLYAAAFLAFLWGMLNYFIIKAGEERGREEARGFILWGLVGLVVIFGVWGMVHLLLNTLFIAG